MIRQIEAMLFQRRSPVLALVIGLLTVRSAIADPPPVKRSLPMFSSTCEDSWNFLFPFAGRPNGELLYSARVVVDSKAPEGGSVYLLLSLTNVSTKCIFFPGGPRDLPGVFIRDGFGHVLELTDEGEQRYWASVTAGGSVCCPIVPPGYSGGTVIPLKAYYDLSKPGKYTVLASQQCGAKDKKPIAGSCVVVSSAATFSIGRAPQKSDRKASGVSQSSAISKANLENRTLESKAAEWDELVRRSGQSIHHCALDVVVSPTETEATTLIVSLRRIELWDPIDNFPPDTGIYPSDYKVLVRDPSGRSIQARLDAETQFSMQHRPAIRMEPLSPASGIGAVIPLAKWFDMKKPGDYSVLVALPSRKDKSCTWVAEPITIRVEAKPAVPKT